MPVAIEATPNPNALKYNVGTEVGPPRTFVAGRETDDPTATELLALDGVASVFMSADFVTISKLPDADWTVIAEEAKAILERRFP